MQGEAIDLFPHLTIGYLLTLTGKGYPVTVFLYKRVKFFSDRFIFPITLFPVFLHK